MTKKITDENGITYEEVSYNTYLKSKNKHRIVKSLESQYFVEIENEHCKWCGKDKKGKYEE